MSTQGKAYIKLGTWHILQTCKQNFLAVLKQEAPDQK